MQDPLSNLIRKSDHNIIRDYVTAMDPYQYDQLPEGVVCIHMTHSNLTAKHMDLRMDLHMTVRSGLARQPIIDGAAHFSIVLSNSLLTKTYTTRTHGNQISDVKERFRKHIGTPVEHQRLILKDQGVPICEMPDNHRMLGFYSVVSGQEIHVIDTDPFSLSRGGGLTDVSLVEKVRMTDEDYDKRKGTMREFIRNQRAKDPNYKLKPKSTPESVFEGMAAAPPPGPESVEGVVVGARCEVMPGKRRGVVKFVGEVEGLKAGHWVGVQFDEPVGHNDGTVKGVRVFECVMGYGSFVRGLNVKTGDFPERDLLDSDEENEEGNAKEENGEDDEDEI